MALPACAQTVSNAADLYGYDAVPLPSPQAMLMPSFQAQQRASYVTPSLYAGQALPHVVASSNPYGIVPNYLPQFRPQNLASSVGYVVQPQSGGVQPNPAMIQPQGQTAPSSSYQPAYTGGSVAAPQGYGNPSYGNASYANPSYGNSAQGQGLAGVNNPPAYSSTPSYGMDPSAGTYASQPQAAGVPSSVPSTNYQVQNSITTPQGINGGYNAGYDATYPGAAQNSYQVAAAQSSQQAYAQPQVQPQVQTFNYGSAPQPQTYTTTQIYTPSPALTSDVPRVSSGSGQASGAADVSPDASMAFDPSTGPWYVTLRSGITIPQDTEFKTKTATISSEYQTGWQLGTGLGYEFKAFNKWLAPRAEVEMTYDQQLVDVHKVNTTTYTDPNAYGFVRSLDLFANGFLDFRLNRNLAPYVGGGVGIGYSDFDRLGVSPGSVVLDDNDVGFVWQAMAGLGISLNNSSTIDLGYRYQNNTGLNLKAQDGTVSTTEEGKHVFMIGFRNNF